MRAPWYWSPRAPPFWRSFTSGHLKHEKYVSPRTPIFVFFHVSTPRYLSPRAPLPLWCSFISGHLKHEMYLSPAPTFLVFFHVSTPKARHYHRRWTKKSNPCSIYSNPRTPHFNVDACLERGSWGTKKIEPHQRHRQPVNIEMGGVGVRDISA